MLNSSVIRAFKAAHPISDSLDASAIVTDEVDFYAHVFLRNGVKMRYWQKIGNDPQVGSWICFFVIA